MKQPSSSFEEWLSFADLQAAGIVKNWQTLKNWQKDAKVRFPIGVLFAPNSRRWSRQRHIEPWLASRPVERDAFEGADTAEAR
jgi:hypothetical protein